MVSAMSNTKDGVGRKPSKRHKRFKGLESDLQRMCASYLNLQYPWVLWTHIANERKAKPQYMKKLKQMGVQPGMPDIMIFHPKRLLGEKPKIVFQSGLAVELKANYNKPSDMQEEIMDKLEDAGWECHWVNSFDEFKEIVDEYLGKR